MRSRSRSPAPTAFDLACRWLGRAPRSQAEIEAKLRHLGFSERAVDKAVRRLCELHYLDDEELARARTRNLAERGYGDLWIERDLERRGL